VWFTRPLNTAIEGSDESITQLSDVRYYLDINDEVGSEITGLKASSDGAVYVFTATSAWRLNETGNPSQPFVPERIGAVGAVANDAIVTVDTPGASSGVYFMSRTGPYRYTPSNGLQWVGEDIAVPGTTYTTTYVAGYDPMFREIHFTNAPSSTSSVLRPDFLRPMQGALRGGWSSNAYAGTSLAIRSYAAYNGTMMVGGTRLSGAAMLATLSYDGAIDITDNFTCTITTGHYVFDEGTRLGTVVEPIAVRHETMGMTVAAYSDFQYETAVIDTVSAVVSGGRTVTKFEGFQLADASAVQFLVTFTPYVASGAPKSGVDRLVVPYSIREPL
jgi:hypothetical protein